MSHFCRKPVVCRLVVGKPLVFQTAGRGFDSPQAHGGKAPGLLGLFCFEPLYWRRNVLPQWLTIERATIRE